DASTAGSIKTTGRRTGSAAAAPTGDDYLARRRSRSSRTATATTRMSSAGGRRDDDLALLRDTRVPEGRARARPPGCDVASRSRYLPIAQRAGRPGHASLRGLFSHRVGRGQPALFIRRARTRRKPKGASMIIDLDVTNLCNRAYKLAEDVRNESSPDNV